MTRNAETDLFVGLDAGTSKLAAVALDTDGRLRARADRPNDADVTGLPTGHHEQSPARILALTIDLLRELCRGLGGRAAAVRGIGLTGQMHGVVLTDDARAPLTNLITWQDRRADEPLADGTGSCLDEAVRRAGPGAFDATGAMPAAGYLGITLFGLREAARMPSGARWALLCHDWLAACLCAGDPVTDPSDAASTALYDVRRRQWERDLCAALGIDAALLPPVQEAGDRMGTLAADIAAATGLPSDAQVGTALGDNQASVLASLHDPGREVLLNVGTGGQTSAVTEQFFRAPDIECRPFPGHRWLSCGMTLCGGAAFRYLAEHYAAVLQAVTGNTIPLQDILTRLASLAATTAPGAAGLRVEPFFAGQRSAPGRRGRIDGMGLANNSPGAWARAFLEGIAREMATHYRAMLDAGLPPREGLVVAGNAMRRNAALRDAAQRAFALPPVMPAWDEEAACGAALAAMVGCGALPSFDAASALVRHVDA